MKENNRREGPVVNETADQEEVNGPAARWDKREVASDGDVEAGRVLWDELPVKIGRETTKNNELMKSE